MGRDNKRRGAVMIFTAVVLMAIILIMGLSVDWAKIAFNVHQLQNAADAAALAGAEKIPWLYKHANGLTMLIDRAQEVAWENSAEQMRVALSDAEQPPGPFSGDESAYDVLVGLYLPQWRGTVNEWRPTTTQVNAVRATARREGPLADGGSAPRLRMLFGPLAGVPSVAAAKSATAVILNANGAALICLAPTGMGINIVGNSSLVVNGGDIYVNSVGDKDDTCVNVDGKGVLDVNSIDMTCGINMCGTIASPRDYDFPVWDYLEDPMPDPLEWVPDLRPLPALGTAKKWDESVGNFVDTLVDVSTLVIDNSTITTYGGIDPFPDPTDPSFSHMLKLTPGYYPKGIRLSNGVKLVLEPGIYAVGGESKSGIVATGGILQAEGVMIYVTDDGAGNWGEINLNGGNESTTKIHISEYKGTAYPDYATAGLAIFQDRSRPAYKNDLDPGQPFFAGGNNSSFSGTVYLHNDSYTTVPRLSGGAGNIGIQVITDRLRVSGGGTVTIDYDGRNNWKEADLLIVR